MPLVLSSTSFLLPQSHDFFHKILQDYYKVELIVTDIGEGTFSQESLLLVVSFLYPVCMAF